MRTSDGLDLTVVEFGGAGRPVLLLHGLMGRAATWWPVAPLLHRFGRVLGYDARGHGRSPARGPWTTDRLAADVADVLGETGPAVVIGHSMGGLHGLVVAARCPGLVRALVVEDTGVDYRGRSAADARAWFEALPQPWPSIAAVREAFGSPWPEYGEYMTECVVERADGYHLLADVEHAIEIAAEWAEVDHWDALPAVHCPVLLLEAEQSIAPPGQMALMADRMPAARHVLVRGTGHLLHRAAPAAYLAAVTAFLDENG